LRFVRLRFDRLKPDFEKGSKIFMNVKSPNTFTKPIHVLLIAKYQMVRDSLKLLIDANREFCVVGSFPYVSQPAELPNGVDVAVIYLSTGDRVEIIAELLELNPDLRVVVIVAGVDLDFQAKALSLGAVGIVQKEQSPKLLIEAIRQTYRGETWLNQVLLNKILEKGKSDPKRSEGRSSRMDTEYLTTRELEVVEMIGLGLKNKSIAKKLFISEATVRHHLSSIYGKVGVEDRLNLVIFAYRNGLIEVPERFEINASKTPFTVSTEVAP
jgi:NarL family two-component system response regulator LiaR